MPPHVLVNSALGDVRQSGGQVKVLRKIYREYIEGEKEKEKGERVYVCTYTRVRERVASYFFALVHHARGVHALHSLQLAREAAAIFFYNPIPSIKGKWKKDI